MRRFTFVLTLALPCLLANTVLAENLEQVLVTATRLPQEGASTPLSWAGIDEDTLRLVNPVHPNEIMQQVPGAWISRGNGQESLTALRSPVLTGAGGCGAFLMAADGISLRAPGFCNVNQLFDANIEQADRVEVIKGPATAVYGSNALHGVINVLSPAPAREPWQEIALERGPDDYYRGRYQYSGQHGAHGLNLRMVGSSDGGYLDDAGYDQQKLSLRHDYTGDGWQLRSVVEGSNLNQETAGFIEGYKAFEDSTQRRNNPNPEAYRDAWSLRAYTQLSLQLTSGRQLRVTPYYRNNSMAFLQHFLPWKALEENGHHSTGLRVSLDSDQGPWQWIAGGDIEHTQAWLRETQAQAFSPNQPQGTHYDYDVNALNAAAFIQARRQLSPRLQIDSGLRLETTRYDYDNRTAEGSACAASASACRFFRPADREDSFNDWSANLGVSLQLMQEHYLFSRLSRGFRAPQSNELYRLQAGQERADLDSEQATNLEIGMRGKLGEGLSYDLSAYHLRKDEVIFQDADRHNVSGAKTLHRGLELSLDYRQKQWYAGLDFSLARHQYDNNPTLLGVAEAIEGNDVDTAPRRFGSARLGWQAQRRSLELEWVYMGEYYLEPGNHYRYAGHNLFNLRASTSLGRGITASLRLTNLLDRDYAERADFGFGEYRYFVGQPRGLYLQVSYRPD